VIRAAPRDEAEQVTQALRGEPLTVEETDGDWARVRTAYDYPGWIRTVRLSPVPGTVPGAWAGSSRSCSRTRATNTSLGLCVYSTRLNFAKHWPQQNRGLMREVR
jgi:hypothetical protein